MRRSVRSGFALPAVLAVTGVVTLIFLVAITALASLTAEAGAARSRVRFMQRAMTAEAAITFMAATEPFSARGMDVGGLRRVNEFLGQNATFSTGVPLAEIRLDGRAYMFDVEGPLLLSLQDQAGLINVARLDEAGFLRLGAAAGLPAAQIRSLRSVYLDYVDADDLSQVNGAERADYPAGTGPANRNLLAPSEWLSLLNARSGVDLAQWRRLKPQLAADFGEGTANINTATLQALEVRFGLTSAQAERVVSARENAALFGLEDLAAVSGAALLDDPQGIYAYPSGRIIFNIKDDRSPWIYRGRVVLTPGNPEKPFWIDQTETLEAPRGASNATRAGTTDAPPFPYAPR